jgi:hypothetical protein
MYCLHFQHCQCGHCQEHNPSFEGADRGVIEALFIWSPRVFVCQDFVAVEWSSIFVLGFRISKSMQLKFYFVNVVELTCDLMIQCQYH